MLEQNREINLNTSKKSNDRSLGQYLIDKRWQLASASAGAFLLLGTQIDRIAANNGINLNPDHAISGKVLEQQVGVKVITLNSEDGVPVQKQVPASFEPDPALHANSDLTLNSVGGADYQTYAEFQSALNTAREGFPKLAGYSYGLNDESDNMNMWRQTQYPAYAWTVVTGLKVSIPGIGTLTGGDHRAVLFLVLNRAKDVMKNVSYVESGFIGTGRLWDANQPGLLNEAARRLSAHFGNSLLNGEVTSGFVGQCDDGDVNCNAIDRVVVARYQWGNNPDGSPRHLIGLVGGDQLR